MEVGSKIEKYTVVNNLLMFSQQQAEGLTNALSNDPQNLKVQTLLVKTQHDIDVLLPVCRRYFKEIMIEIEKETGMEPLQSPGIKRDD